MKEVLFKSLGEKAYSDQKKADQVATVRLCYAALHVVTCFAIIANCVHQW